MLTLLPLLAMAALASPDTTPAVPPTGEVLIVANQGDATVHVVEAATGRSLAVIPSAPAPHEVAVTSDGRWAVVTNYGDQTVGRALTVIDVSTQTAVRRIDLSPHARPHGIAFLPGDSLMAITSETSRALLLVSFPDGAVRAAIPTEQQGTHILAVAPGGGKVWTANVFSGSITEIDLATRRALRTIPVGPSSEGAALSPDGSRIWVASMGRDTTYVFDTATGARVAAVPTPGHAYRVTMSLDGRHALIPAPEAGLVRAIDTETMEATVIPVPGGPGGVVPSPDGQTAYVPVMQTGEVAVIDLRLMVVTRHFSVGAAPDGMAVSRYFNR